MKKTLNFFLENDKESFLGRLESIFPNLLTFDWYLNPNNKNDFIASLEAYLKRDSRYKALLPVKFEIVKGSKVFDNETFEFLKTLPVNHVAATKSANQGDESGDENNKWWAKFSDIASGFGEVLTGKKETTTTETVTDKKTSVGKVVTIVLALITFGAVGYFTFRKKGGIL